MSLIEYGKQIDELMAENIALKSRITDLEMDGERLDWLDSFDGYGCMNPVIFGRYSHKRPPVRQAIDAAIIASQKPDGGGKGK